MTWDMLSTADWVKFCKACCYYGVNYEWVSVELELVLFCGLVLLLIVTVTLLFWGKKLLTKF